MKYNKQKSSRSKLCISNVFSLVYTKLFNTRVNLCCFSYLIYNNTIQDIAKIMDFESKEYVNDTIFFQ